MIIFFYLVRYITFSPKIPKHKKHILKSQNQINKTEACGFPIQLIYINVKSTVALEPFKGNSFFHETDR